MGSKETLSAGRGKTPYMMSGQGMNRQDAKAQRRRITSLLKGSRIVVEAMISEASAT